jgi:hypothetical protein
MAQINLLRLIFDFKYNSAAKATSANQFNAAMNERPIEGMGNEGALIFQLVIEVKTSTA